MKLGVHLSTYTKKWGEDLKDYIKLSKEIGFDGVEIPLPNPYEVDVNSYRKILEECNLECTCGTGLNELADISSLDREVRENGKKHLKRCLDICNELGSDTLGGVLYAPWGAVANKEVNRKNIEYSIEILREIGDYAKEKNVTIALEILNRYESYFINTVEEGLDVLKRINNSNVKLHFDTFHGHIEEKNMREAILLGGKNIHHVHICENNRSSPGTGQIDFKNIYNALIEINYDRWLTIENFVMANCEVGDGTFIWRDTEVDGITAAKKGYEFLRKLTNR